jgi:Fe-S-cluster containining protein
MGLDVWRISRALRLSPELFVLAHDQPEPADDGFLLEPGGWPQGLALDKRGEFGPGQPCVFLAELGGGYAGCGVYEHRPAVCRTYPMALRGSSVAIREDALCPEGAWLEGGGDEATWRWKLRTYRERWDEYVAVVEEWNDQVRALGSTRRTVPEYLLYLVNTYDRLGEALMPYRSIPPSAGSSPTSGKLGSPTPSPASGVKTDWGTHA